MASLPFSPFPPFSALVLWPHAVFFFFSLLGLRRSTGNSSPLLCVVEGFPSCRKPFFFFFFFFFSPPKKGRKRLFFPPLAKWKSFKGPSFYFVFLFSFLTFTVLGCKTVMDFPSPFSLLREKRPLFFFSPLLPPQPPGRQEVFF